MQAFLMHIEGYIISFFFQDYFFIGERYPSTNKVYKS